MSKSNGRPAVAFQTSYDALAVEHGEESDEEEVASDVPPPADTETATPVKMTRTAQKKAAQAARLEKKRAKAASRGTPSEDAPPPVSPPVDSPTTEEDATLGPAESTYLVVPPPADAAPADAAPAPAPPPPATNGHVKHNTAAHPEIPAYPLSTKAATEPEAVLPEPPLQRAAAPVVAAVKQTAETVSSAATAVAEPVQAALSKASESAKDALAKTPVNSVVAPPEDPEKAKKRQNALTRTLWTFIMIGGFLALMLMGHAYMILLVMLCQTIVYREVTALFSLKTMDNAPEAYAVKESKGRDPWSKTLNWYFFAVTNYFLYGESIIYYFKHVVFVDSHLTSLANQHRFISFMLYIIGFMGFVGSLKRGYLKQQFGLFCWVHMTLLLVVVSSHFIVNNILEGLIWFWVPASLVICNDIFAYICGVTMGRTPLIALSPKKTVEGFVGAFVCTVLFSLAWGTYFMRFDYMVCPAQDLGTSAFSAVTCLKNPVFIWRDAPLPAGIAAFLSTMLGRAVTTFPYAPYQIHLLAMSSFASLAAPFGGFFASGFKRAFNIKDFGDSIPGHGGMTDRMDCQFLMGVFAYVYYSSLIRQHLVTVGAVMQTVTSGLSPEDQLQLLVDLRRYIEGQGIVIGS